MARKSKKTKPPVEASQLPTVEGAVIGIVVFLSPLVAGKLSPTPALAMQSLVVVAAMIWLAKAVRLKTISLPSRAATWLAGLFFLILLVSAVGSAGIYLTLRELLNFGSYLLVFLIIGGLSGSRTTVFGILGALMVSGMIVGALGIREYSLSGIPAWRTFSTFFNPDFLAGFAAMILPVILGWYLSKRFLSVTLITGMGVLVILAGILMSGSRFGLLASAGGTAVFLVFALLSRSIGKAQVGRLLVVIPLALAVFLMMGKPIEKRISSVRADSHSGGFRIYTWRGTARMAQASPLKGTGLGTFEIAYPKYALVGFTKLAHNSYLQLAAESGPTSTIVLLAFLGVVLVPAAGGLIRQRHSMPVEAGWMPEHSLVLSGLLGGVSASVARNIVDSDWYVTAIGISFWAMLGIIATLSGQTMDRKFGAKLAFPSVGILSIGLLGAVLMIAGEITFAQGVASWRQYPTKSLAILKTSMKVDAMNPAHHRMLGNVYLVLFKATGERKYAGNAIREFNSAIRFEQASARNYYQLAKIYESESRSQDAVAALLSAQRRDPNSPEVLYALARQYESAGEKEQALFVWKRMVQVQNSDYERVRAFLELVRPEYVFAHYALGQDHEKQGELDLARKEYRRALDVTARYEGYIKSMGDILQAGERRNVQMEAQVSETTEDIRQHLAHLDTPSR